MTPALLIATKLHIPHAYADLVARPKLFQVLDDSLRAPLTLVSAPAGFGKSTLLAGWLQPFKTDIRTAWLSLDENDNEPGVFWQYFIYAIQNACQVGKSPLGMLSTGVKPGMQAVLATLINELAELTSPLLIVLDDYHLINAPDIHENLNFLIDHQPGIVHLAILTREDPPLGLARRRARRQLVEIRASELRFDTREAGEFLNQARKLSLTPDQVDTL